jgi:hypothetical protein
MGRTRKPERGAATQQTFDAKESSSPPPGRFPGVFLNLLESSGRHIAIS